MTVQKMGKVGSRSNGLLGVFPATFSVSRHELATFWHRLPQSLARSIKDQSKGRHQNEWEMRSIPHLSIISCSAIGTKNVRKRPSARTHHRTRLTITASRREPKRAQPPLVWASFVHAKDNRAGSSRAFSSAALLLRSRLVLIRRKSWMIWAVYCQTSSL